MQIQLFGNPSSAIGESPDIGAGTNRSQPAGATGSTAPEDTATISSDGASLSSLSVQAMQLASTMESRILSLREAVTSGQYGLEPNEIADAMLSDGM
jgi:flagellar biosynthesis anti-sigma factor FlgM